MASYVLVALLALISILQRNADNVLLVTSLNVYDAAAAAGLAQLPWAAAPGVGTGLRVRLHAAGEAGACAVPLSWSAYAPAGAAPAWRLTSSAVCGDERVSMHDFVCPTCDLGAESGLAVTLHYSCQVGTRRLASFPRRAQPGGPRCSAAV